MKWYTISVLLVLMAMGALALVGCTDTPATPVTSDVQAVKAPPVAEAVADVSPEQTCDSLRGCQSVLTALPDGTQDAFFATVLKSCMKDEKTSPCLLAAMMMADGTVTVEKPVLQLGCWAIACDNDNVHGCFQLGLLCEKGTLGEPDLKMAVRCYEKVCDLGYGVGCFNATIALAPVDNPENADKALVLANRGCKMEVPKACEMAGHLQALKDLQTKLDARPTVPDDVVTKKAGITWVVKGELADHIVLKKAKCSAPTTYGRSCKLTFHCPLGYTRRELHIESVQYDSDGVSLDRSPSVGIRLDGTPYDGKARINFATEGGATKVVIQPRTR